MAKMIQDKMDEAVLSLDLPGFRFHPTEEELLEFYLRNVIFHEKLYFDVIGFLNIYRHDPWELPDLSKVGEREWYFFVPRDKKPSNGGRSSRTTPTGYWKATGSERKVVTLSDPKRVIGSRKTLVFYKGRAPRGTKTDWIMNEYRLPDNRSLPKDIVLCKVYRKATSLKVLEQWATIGEAKTMTTWSIPESTPQFQESYYTTSDLSNGGTANAASHYGPHEDMKKPMINCHVDDDALLWDEGIEMVTGSCKADEIRLPLGQVGLPELQVPKIVDWAQDPLWAQLCSPLFDNIFSQTTPCANL